MKTSLTISLALAFVYIQLFGWQMLHLEKRRIKEQVTQSVPQTETLVHLSFGQDQLSLLEWEDEKEFEWNGMMYDVVSISHKKDSTVFVCYADKEESIVNECLEELEDLVWGIKKKNDSPNKTKRTEGNDLFVVQSIDDLSNALSTVNRSIYSYLFSFANHCASILGPPPKY